MLKSFLKTLIIVGLTIAPLIAIAGGPFVVETTDHTGVALRWVDDTLTWHADPGKLSDDIDNATAREWVEDALGSWKDAKLENADRDNIATTLVNTDYAGVLSEDVDATNYGEYISDDPGPTAIIFDDTGDIIVALVGEENRETVVGLSQPLLTDSTGLRLTKGFVILNGLLQSNGVLSENQDDANDLFRATTAHELGHLLNIDHTQVNLSVGEACVRNGSCPNEGTIPTMYPQLLTPRQMVLTRDDKITVSWIYPTTAFGTNFCTITGEIFDEDGDPIKGVNVIASRVGDGDTLRMADSRSFVSGALYSSCYGNSQYHLHGIVPGKEYEVTYEPISGEFTGASDLEPLDRPPRNFTGGTIGEGTVSCESGGETIEMSALTIDLSGSNPCTFTDDDDDDDDSSSSSSTCSLMTDASSDSNLAVILFLLALLPIFIVRRIEFQKI